MAGSKGWGYVAAGIEPKRGDVAEIGIFFEAVLTLEVLQHCPGYKSLDGVPLPCHFSQLCWGSLCDEQPIVAVWCTWEVSWRSSSLASRP